MHLTDSFFFFLFFGRKSICILGETSDSSEKLSTTVAMLQRLNFRVGVSCEWEYDHCILGCFFISREKNANSKVDTVDAI